MTTRSLNRLTTLALATALFAAACGSDSVEVRTDTPTEPTADTPTEPTADTPTEPVEPRSPLADLADAEDRWETADLAGYEITYREVCFCPEIIVRVTVEDGQVTETVSLSEYEREEPGRTVESLFAEIRSAIDGGAASVNAEYDAELGYPTSYFIDFSEEIADEEFGITVQSLVPAG